MLMQRHYQACIRTVQNLSCVQPLRVCSDMHGISILPSGMQAGLILLSATPLISPVTASSCLSCRLRESARWQIFVCGS